MARETWLRNRKSEKRAVDRERSESRALDRHPRANPTAKIARAWRIGALEIFRPRFDCRVSRKISYRTEKHLSRRGFPKRSVTPFF